MVDELKAIKFDIDSILDRKQTDAKRALDSYIDLLELARKEWEELNIEYFTPDLENSVICSKLAKQARDILISINHEATGHGDIK